MVVFLSACGQFETQSKVNENLRVEGGNNGGEKDSGYENESLTYANVRLPLDKED